MKIDRHDQGSGDRLVRGELVGRRVPAPRLPGAARLREGRACRHRGRVERRRVAPPRGDLDVDRGRGARLQGRRPRVLELRSGAGRHHHDRGWRARPRPGAGLDRRWLRDARRRYLGRSTSSPCTRPSSPPRRSRRTRLPRPAAGPEPAAPTSPTRPGRPTHPQLVGPGRDDPRARHGHERRRDQLGQLGGGRTGDRGVEHATGPDDQHARHRPSRGRPVTPSASPAPPPTRRTAASPRAACRGRSSSGHCIATGCHTHPLATRTGVASGTIAASGPRGAVVHGADAHRDRCGGRDRERRAPHRPEDGQPDVPDQPAGAVARRRCRAERAGTLRADLGRRTPRCR